jgi:large subunit ribosomal protein L10
MPMSRERKQEEVAHLKEAIQNADSVTFVNFHGLTVDEAQQLRAALRENGVNYKVVKKTLTKLALDEAGVDGERPDLTGELAIAYSDDYLEPARSVYKFEKQFDGRVSILGGIFDGEYRDQQAMVEIAQIPSRETLQGMFVNVINSPIQGFVGVLNQIAEQKQA